MATPSRTRHRLRLAPGPVEVDVLGSAPSSTGPAVLLIGGLEVAGGERAALRLARAGFTVVACGRLAPDVVAAVSAHLQSVGIEGTAPTSLGVLVLPLAAPGGDEDLALDAAVRELAARLT